MWCHRCHHRAASAAGFTDTQFLTCEGRPESHRDLRTRAGRCGPQRRQEAEEEEEEERGRSERPAEEREHTCQSPEEERRRGEVMRRQSKLQTSYVSLLPVRGLYPVNLPLGGSYTA